MSKIYDKLEVSHNQDGSWNMHLTDSDGYTDSFMRVDITSINNTLPGTECKVLVINEFATEAELQEQYGDHWQEWLDLAPKEQKDTE